MKLVAKILSLIPKIWDRFLMCIFRSSFKECGKEVLFHPFNSSFTYSNISLGNRVYIGENARFWCTESAIKIADYVVIGPSVSIIAGNHSSHLVGKRLVDYKISDKRPEDDLPVFIDEDVWIGTNVTILNGVHIGRGSIIAAGSIVKDSVSAYSIVGVKAKVLKRRFTLEQVLLHEAMIYPVEKRYTKEQINKLWND